MATVGAITYPSAREAWKKAELNWPTQNFKLALVDSTYVFSEAHNFLDDVSSAVVATSANLSSKTQPEGILHAAPVSFISLPPGETIIGYVIYRDSGSAATSELLVYIDQNSDRSAFEFSTDDHVDVTISWPDGILY